jgi:hypothetical protein
VIAARLFGGVSVGDGPAHPLDQLGCEMGALEIRRIDSLTQRDSRRRAVSSNRLHDDFRH